MPHHLATHRSLQIALALLVALLAPTAALVVLASAFSDIPGPAGSGAFGTSVTALTNGNFVVTDPLYDSGAVTDVGAAYLYNGVTRQLIATLAGSTAGDQVGSGGDSFGSTGVIALSDGNFVVLSPQWHNAAAAYAGAATWCSGTAGCAGVVTTTNSLVGSKAGDNVGYGATPLNNGNYVVISSSWDNGAVDYAGAVTWCSGTAPCTGAVATTNSLVGSALADWVGDYQNVVVLTDGNYVVLSRHWQNYTGAVTWCSGTAGCAGVVTTTNSLVGSDTGEASGGGLGVTALKNGNYVVSNALWRNGDGAATWCSGTLGCTGVVTATNSLVGSALGGHVGLGVTALTNGNYVVLSPNWSNGPLTQTGAVTWCNGTVGCTGTVTTTNSLVGTTASDHVGNVTALSNGNYVVSSPDWQSGTAAKAGAATWCSGTLGCTGVVTTTNSLVGSSVGGGGVVALSNGHYVVLSPGWSSEGDNRVGAVTWCGQPAGCTGVVTTTNSLVGGTFEDHVGAFGATVLSNGDYVVRSAWWHNGAVANAGAVTWCSGTAGCVGLVTTSNSLVGTTAGDTVGVFVTALPNGNYVVGSPFWHNGAVPNAGAVTWCSGASGCVGPVTASNSLVGGTAGDNISGFPNHIIALSNGNYLVHSPAWHNGAAVNTGAVTLGDGAFGTVGPISADNSVLGTAAGGGSVMVAADDSLDDQIVVGRPKDNLVSLLRLFKVHLPLVTRH